MIYMEAFEKLTVVILGPSLQSARMFGEISEFTQVIIIVFCFAECDISSVS